MTSCTVLLLVLCSSLTPVLGCDWLGHYDHLSNISLLFLKRMGGQLTNELCPVPFPNKFYDHIRNTTVESQLVFIRDSLELIVGLYHHDNRSSAGWDTFKTDRFLMTLHRQIDGLNTCVSINRRAESRLRKYYRRLETRTLYSTGGSPASWELIRMETKRHLDQLDLLVAFIKAPPTSGGRCTPTQH